LIIEILEALSAILAAFMTAYLVRHYIFTLTVLKDTRKGKATFNNEVEMRYPKVSILIPARNEERVIGRILQRMTELTYPKDKMEVIVIDDASTDKTSAIANQYATTYEYIKVIRRSEKHGGKGKASALNAGFKNSSGEIIFCFDADYYPQSNIIEKLVREFTDPKVGIVQGRITVLNEPHNVITRLVALERIGGYRIDQQARGNLGLIPQFGGTVGGIRRTLLELLSGWDENTLAEDTELTFRAYLAGYKVRYVNEAECYEEAVESWQAYWKQRYRWAKGHMQCAFKHTLKVLKSKNLNVKEKIDSFLLLNVYFMPILALLSLIIGVSLFLLKPQQPLSMLWPTVPISIYGFVGNFAPFFEVGVGTYLDGRTRAQWLLPLLVFVFIYNIPICTKALVDLCIAKLLKRNANHWTKTAHSGNGNSYIASHGIPSKRS
jgi:cellulose synthase/poly-beta-1,6-N-acetylglucosamine synthase-like glycosyltransferase